MAKAIPDRIAELEALDTRELRARWQRAYGQPAPKHASRDLLLRAVAHRLQEQAEGGPSKAALRRLAKLAALNGGGSLPTPPSLPRLKPGSRLIREWRGKVHHVTVLEEGFDYCGTRYGSLSHIARTITGARWSGPLFFGLRKTGARAQEPTNGR